MLSDSITNRSSNRSQSRSRSSLTWSRPGPVRCDHPSPPPNRNVHTARPFAEAAPPPSANAHHIRPSSIRIDPPLLLALVRDGKRYFYSRQLHIYAAPYRRLLPPLLGFFFSGPPPLQHTCRRTCGVQLQRRMSGESGTAHVWHVCRHRGWASSAGGRSSERTFERARVETHAQGRYSCPSVRRPVSERSLYLCPGDPVRGRKSHGGAETTSTGWPSAARGPAAPPDVFKRRRGRPPSVVDGCCGGGAILYFYIPPEGSFSSFLFVPSFAPLLLSSRRRRRECVFGTARDGAGRGRA